LAVVYHLPNRVYFPSLSGMEDENLYTTLGNLYVYASLELLSLVVLHAVLRHKFHLPGIAQLAFVLEQQWSKVQSRLVFWVLYNAQPPLLHFGSFTPNNAACGRLETDDGSACPEGFDYTFKFAWLHQNQAATDSTGESS
jgi:hypothetical protein